MTTPEPKKRGRKKKSETVIVIEQNADTDAPVDQEIPPPDAPKKRGRKPKGGKIVPIVKPHENIIEKSKNIILHLKCCLQDLQHDNNATGISAYEIINNDYELLNNNNNNIMDTLHTQSIDNNNIINNIDDIETLNSHSTNQTDEQVNKDIVLTKINTLRLNLSKNNISDKRSACFWCTYEFHNPPIFIPKSEKNDGYQVYGCFCTPECGVAYLMEEMIDSSIKFERYQLMNYIYGKSLKYESNIKPAPDPHYLLDKYYGNLTIDEYRSTLRNNNYLIFVDKPLTHVFPEMFNDNHDFTLMKDGGSSNGASLSQYKIKKTTDGGKKPKTKSEIAKEKFGAKETFGAKSD